MARDATNMPLVVAAIVSVTFFITVIRLRQVYREASSAMNVIKEFYICLAGAVFISAELPFTDLGASILAGIVFIITSSRRSSLILLQWCIQRKDWPGTPPIPDEIPILEEEPL